ncbi:hypothetical protein JXO59_15145, partial [candidate division KSB1 bacterium]|nr:hypothetical protein [candidate division KSB1 bacterium]
GTTLVGASAGALAGAIAGVGVGAVPGAVAGGHIGFSAGVWIWADRGRSSIYQNSIIQSGTTVFQLSLFPCGQHR